MKKLRNSGFGAKIAYPISQSLATSRATHQHANRLLLCLLALILALTLVACPNKADPILPKVKLLSIAVTPIWNGEYCVGDTITEEDIRVIATYDDGTTKEVSTWTVDDPLNSPQAAKTITISYTEDEVTKSAQLTITIRDEYYNSYAFTETPTDIPATDGYEGTAGSSGSYVYFGDWPQTIKPGNVRINKNQKRETGLFTYYAGSDGQWYLPQSEKAYDMDAIYKYSDNTSVNPSSKNSTRWFRVEPIKWRVLEETSGEKFLLAENGLMALPYYDTAGETRTITGEIAAVESNNYKYSKIRAWLNGLSYQKGTATCDDYKELGFLQTAFTATAQGKISTTSVDNSGASTLVGSNQYSCADTEDKIFLLSIAEAREPSYDFEEYNEYSEDNIRIRKPTDFALATGAYGSEFGGIWWLRSPYSKNSRDACYIYYVGNVFTLNTVAWSGAVVVPALKYAP